MLEFQRLRDAHVHLDFIENAEEVARDAAADGAVLFANTVSPGGWLASRERFAEFSNVKVGFGMHPWWVGGSEWPGAEAIVKLLDEHDPTWIGEIGLDLGPRHADTRAEQVATFTSIARWAGERGGRILSIHSVKGARDALDILEAGGNQAPLATCTCIFHWFTGPSDQLKRAIDAGCWFSANERMLATKRGREYARIIPAERLLLESDAPPEQGQRYSYAELAASLDRTARAIAEVRA